MRVLFVDFDGVLHPLGPWIEISTVVNAKEATRTETVDFFCWAQSLEDLLGEHRDVRVVVHSSWRVSHTIDQIAEYLGPLGWRFVGCTDDSPKYHSIISWLAANPTVQSYRILDDEVGDFPVNPVLEEFIACDHRTGVTASGVRRQLVEWLRSA